MRASRTMLAEVQKVIIYYINDKRICLHTINKLPRRTAQQVGLSARRPDITGFSTNKKLPQNGAKRLQSTTRGL